MVEELTTTEFVTVILLLVSGLTLVLSLFALGFSFFESNFFLKNFPAVDRSGGRAGEAQKKENVK